MKRVATAVLALLGSALLAACGEPEKPAPSAAPPPATPAPTAGAKSAYPMDTCVVSGEKLGAMGDPVVIQHQGTEVRFCCAKCIEEFRKDPARYMALLKTAKERK